MRKIGYNVLIAIIVVLMISFFLPKPKSVSADELSTLRVIKNQAVLTPKKDVNVNEYIQSKKEILKQRNQQEPDREIAATVSFSRWLTIDEAMDTINLEGIEPISILYAFRGKDLGRGETRILPDSSIKETWNEVMKLRLEHFSSELASQRDSVPQINQDTLKDQARKKILQIKDNTPIVYSFRINAPLNVLSRLESNSNVRLIDVVDQKSAQQLMARGIPESNVVFPGLIPDDLEYFRGIPNELK